MRLLRHGFTGCEKTHYLKTVTAFYRVLNYSMSMRGDDQKQAAMFSYHGHALTENRNGLVVAAEATLAATVTKRDTKRGNCGETGENDENFRSAEKTRRESGFFRSL
jgi:hypothetical protein